MSSKLNYFLNFSLDISFEDVKAKKTKIINQKDRVKCHAR